MPTAELVGRVGRLTALQPPDEDGLTLSIRVLAPGGGQGSSSNSSSSMSRATACALTADALGLATEGGHVYAAHLTKARYTCLDTLGTACTAAAFMSRLSRRLFVGCADGGLHCYDLASSSRLAQLPGHRVAMASLSTKPDTEQLLSASADAVLLWDMATFRKRRMLGGAPHGSCTAAFSPAGNLIAAASPGGAITLWDAKSLRELVRLQAPAGAARQRFGISSISISPDEAWLLVGCQSPALLLVYDLRGQVLQHALQLPRDMWGVNQVQVLPDSRSAAVLTADGCVSFMDVSAAALTGQLQLTSPGCRAASFSTDPRANTMAVVCTDGLVRLYDLGVVRARQHRTRPAQQLSRLQEAELQQLPAGGEALLPQPGPAAGRQQPLREVGNVPAGSGRAAAKPAGAGPIRGSSGGRQAGQAAGGGELSVRRLDAPAAALNKRKLQEMLLLFGEFPTRYRRLIWEHLLQLPHNSAAFALLQDQGLHPAFKDLPQQLQLPGSSCSSVGVRLQRCLSQLAHWCPLFAEVGFLPSFAFPFVKLFGPKAESAFEALATLLINWAKGWFELFPNPPLPLLRRFLLLVSYHDAELGSHLQQLGVPLLEQLWQHMSGAMSDLLPSASDWLVLWDHCLAAAGGPAFFHTALCSYLLALRQQLLAARDAQQLVVLFAARPVVDVRKVITRAHALHEATPPYARLGPDSLAPLPRASTADADAGGSGYPVFTEAPTGSVEAAHLERQRIQEAEEALIRRRQLVAELQQRSKQVSYETSALTSQRQQLAALDAQRRAALRAIEESLATATARLDDRAKEEKLRQIRMAEEAYQASLASLRAEWSAELVALKADVDHKQRLAAAQLKARQEEEDIKALEFQAQQRLFALQQQELAAAGSSAMRDAAAAQAGTLAAQLQRRAAEWQAEDEVAALRQQHELARQARLAAAAEQEAALQAAKGLLLAEDLRTQEELAKVQHARRLRQVAEEEAELTAQQLQLQAERQAVAAAAGRQAIQEQTQAQVARFEQQQQERMAAIAAEREALQQQLSRLRLSAAELGSTSRLSEVEQQMGSLEESLQQADREHAARVAALLEKLQGRQASGSRAGQAEHRASSVAASVASPQPTHGTSTQAAGAAAAAAAAAASQGAAQSEQQAGAVASSQVTGQLATSLEAVEQRLAAIRQRRAALEGTYGLQVDAELQQQLLQQRQQQTAAGAAASSSAQRGAGRRSAAPTSEASAGSGSSGATSKATASSSGGPDIAAELEQLLAEAEAEVQHELAVARAHLAGSQPYPHSSTAGGAQQRQLSSLQSGVAGHARGASAGASVAQRSSNTASSGAAGGGASSATPPAATAPAQAPAASGSRLKPVLEEAPAAGRQQQPSAAAAVTDAGAKPADSSSSSSSSPERRGEGVAKEGGKAKAGGTQPQGQAAAAAAAAPSGGAAGPSAVQGPGGSSQGSGTGHGGQPAVSRGRGSPQTHFSSPGSTFSASSGEAAAVTSQVPSTAGLALRARAGGAGAVAAGAATAGGLYQPVLLQGAAGGGGALRASAATERLLAVLAGQPGSPAYSGGTTSSTTSKPSSLSFDVPAGSSAAPGQPAADTVTPMLGLRSQARTGQPAAAADGGPVQLRFGSTGTASSTNSSAEASLHTAAGAGSGGEEGGEAADSGGEGGGALRASRGLEASGRVSSDLRRSSSATSEELENLLQQLSKYEEHLLQEAQSYGALPDDLAPRPRQRAGAGSEVATSLGGSSVSWSQTLEGLGDVLRRVEGGNE